MASSMLSRLRGGPKTLIAFVAILFAYTVQTESTQHIQYTLRFEKPLQLLYVTHSSFILLLPLQLVALRVLKGKPASHYLGLLRRDIQKQIDHVRASWGWSPAQTSSSLYATLALILFLLTLGLTIPAVSWFIALPLTTMANVTAIYNTFSIWALVFSVLFLNETWIFVRHHPLTQHHAIAVLLGVVGVVMVAYGSTQPAANATMSVTPIVSRALIGNGMAFLGAVSMAAYEVVYKLIGTVPDLEHAGFRPLAPSEEHAEREQDQPPHDDEPLPFGMHAIAMTTGIGLMTMLTLWSMLVIADWTGFEPFALPPNWTTVGWIATGASCGVLFNACFSILLSLWGPVLASMSCLLTTVLVQLVDLFLGVPFTWVTLTGCAIIAVSFVGLLPWQNKD